MTAGGFPNSGHNYIQDNRIIGNNSGIKDDIPNDITNVIEHNIVKNNTGNTGIHLAGGSPQIINNWLIGDAYSAISCDSGSVPYIYNNAILQNTVYGVVNLDNKVNVNAENNWWGANDGPGGAGTGKGDKVSSNVDFANWLTQFPSIHIVVSRDTLFMTQGALANTNVFIGNYQNLSDSVKVTLTESSNLIQGPKSLGIKLQDSGGTGFSIDFKAPASVSKMIIDKIIINAQSITNQSTTAKDSFYVAVYQQKLAQIYIDPSDTVYMHPGDSISFYATGIDSYQNIIQINPVWTATGGTIDALGNYTAGSNLGSYLVSAKDVSSGITNSTVVIIKNGALAVNDKPTTNNIQNSEITLYQNYPNPFSETTTIWFNVLTPDKITLGIYNILGETITVLDSRVLEAGSYSYIFNRNNLPDGIYFYRVTSNRTILQKGMLIISK